MVNETRSFLDLATLFVAMIKAHQYDLGLCTEILSTVCPLPEGFRWLVKPEQGVLEIKLINKFGTDSTSGFMGQAWMRQLVVDVKAIVAKMKDKEDTNFSPVILMCMQNMTEHARPFVSIQVNATGDMIGVVPHNYLFVSPDVRGRFSKKILCGRDVLPEVCHLYCTPMVGTSGLWMPFARGNGSKWVLRCVGCGAESVPFPHEHISTWGQLREAMETAGVEQPDS